MPAQRVTSRGRAGIRKAMQRVRQFFSWWFRELGEAFSHRGRPSLALLITDREIALIERGADTPFGVVALDAPDRRERIEALRSAAEKRAGGTANIELRLPREQVFFAELPAPLNLERGAEAEIAVASKQARDDLVFAVSPPHRDAAGEIVRDFAATLRDSVADALKHARAWGFQPTRVTSNDWPEAFLDGPEFFVSYSRTKSPLQRRIAFALAGLAALIAAAAAARTLGAREALAEREMARAAAIRLPGVDRAAGELSLARFADGASAAVEARTDTTPVWYILAELARIKPADLTLSRIDIGDGQIRLEGTGFAIDRLISALERSGLFTAPRIIDTSAGAESQARFEIVASLSGEERG